MAATDGDPGSEGGTTATVYQCTTFLGRKSNPYKHKVPPTKDWEVQVTVLCPDGNPAQSIYPADQPTGYTRPYGVICGVTPPYITYFGGSTYWSWAWEMTARSIPKFALYPDTRATGYDKISFGSGPDGRPPLWLDMILTQQYLYEPAYYDPIVHRWIYRVIANVAEKQDWITYPPMDPCKKYPPTCP